MVAGPVCVAHAPLQPSLMILFDIPATLGFFLFTKYCTFASA